MSKKSSALAAAGILAAAVVLSGFSIYKDSHQKNSTDGTITLRMAQTSSQAGASDSRWKHLQTGFTMRPKENIRSRHTITDSSELRSIRSRDVRWERSISQSSTSPRSETHQRFQALDIPYLITSTEQADAVFLGISNRFLTSFPASSLRTGDLDPVSAT